MRYQRTDLVVRFDTISFIEEIKKYLETYSYRELEKRTGVSAATICRIVKDPSRLPSLETAINLAKFMGLPISYFIKEGHDGNHNH